MNKRRRSGGLARKIQVRTRFRETAEKMSESDACTEQTFQCMEIWGGIEPVQRAVSTPGLDLWVYSQPFEGDAQGGDVYYVTLCGGGIITRIVVADVSGHGSSVAEFALSLRSILRKNINQKSQKRLVERLNRQFTEMAGLRRFATALIITYLASTNRLSVCNAGHPRPLFYNVASGTWSLLAPHVDGAPKSGNLPLGLDEETSYKTFDLALARGDCAVFYTDALIEAADESGKLLGENGLLEAAGRLDATVSSPRVLGTGLVREVDRYRGRPEPGDDVTLIVLRHSASGPRRLSIGQKVEVYAKVFGWKQV
jgi:sigma-B regulation protein RsbU (phosphoserine phosphatase)